VKHFLSCLLLLFAAPSPPVSEPPLDQAALRAHIQYLADDALQGRKPGTVGGDEAAHYIARQFHAIGLEPGAKGGNWYQPVALVERIPRLSQQLWYAKDHPLRLEPSQIQLSARDGHLAFSKADVIFAGYALDAPRVGFDDLRNVDVRGKVVLILSGRPEGVNAPGLEVRREAVARAGAVAVIALTGSSDPWEIIREQLDRGRTSLAEAVSAPLQGALSYAGWSDLFAAAGADAQKLVTAAGTPGFRAIPLALQLDATATTTVRPFTSANVVARLAGNDRPDEAVLFLAHWDHLGICRPAGVPDRICNGAVDNASGVALLIEVARRLASGPRPHRSIYFVATTAEELGLLGSHVLAEDPPVSRDHVAAAFNFDTVAIAPAGEPVATIGAGYTKLDPLIVAAARAQGRKLDESGAANAFLTRQDGWELLKAGIPAVMIGGAYADGARLAAFLSGNYHHPSDDLAHLLPLDGAAEDGALDVVLGRMAADPMILLLPSRH